jgi:hypothetical protein
VQALLNRFITGTTASIIIIIIITSCIIQSIMHGTSIMESPSTNTHKTEHTNIWAGYQLMMTGIFIAHCPETIWTLRRPQNRERTARICVLFHALEQHVLKSDRPFLIPAPLLTVIHPRFRELDLCLISQGRLSVESLWQKRGLSLEVQ